MQRKLCLLVQKKFELKDVLAELDELLRSYCQENRVNRQVVSNINIRTLNYVKKCNKQKPSRNIKMAETYLKDHDLLVIPFDKGIRICILKCETYEEKLSDNLIPSSIPKN